MNNLFVPYEESLILKELGFDEPTNYLYNSSDDTPKPFPCDRIGVWMDWNSIYKHESTKHLLSAPLYQQAFDWFREKYNLPSYIRSIWQAELNAFSYQWHIVENKEDWNGIEHFKTYKEAQIACLQRMIEIIKLKNKL